LRNKNEKCEKTENLKPLKIDQEFKYLKVEKLKTMKNYKLCGGIRKLKYKKSKRRQTTNVEIRGTV